MAALFEPFEKIRAIEGRCEVSVGPRSGAVFEKIRRRAGSRERRAGSSERRPGSRERCWLSASLRRGRGLCGSRVSGADAVCADRACPARTRFVRIARVRRGRGLCGSRVRQGERACVKDGAAVVVIVAGC